MQSFQRGSGKQTNVTKKASFDGAMGKNETARRLVTNESSASLLRKASAQVSHTEPA